MSKVKRLLSNWWNGFKVCMFTMIVCAIGIGFFLGIPYLLFSLSPWLCGVYVVFIDIPLFGYMLIHSGN